MGFGFSEGVGLVSSFGVVLEVFVVGFPDSSVVASVFSVVLVFVVVVVVAVGVGIVSVVVDGVEVAAKLNFRGADSFGRRKRRDA